MFDVVLVRIFDLRLALVLNSKSNGVTHVDIYSHAYLMDTLFLIKLLKMKFLSCQILENIKLQLLNGYFLISRRRLRDFNSSGVV